MRHDGNTTRSLLPLGLALLGSALFAAGATEAAQRKVLFENFTMEG
jgi:hypothetical protein